MQLRALLAVPLLAACAVEGSVSAQFNPASDRALASAADPVRLHDDVAWLADDAREGRRAGTAAERESAEWIAARLAELGLEPAGEPSSGNAWFQEFDVPLPVEDGGGSRIVWAGGELGAGDIAPLFCSDGGEAEGALVWRRHGIVDDERGRDDYAGMRVDGRVVLLVRGAPPLPTDEVPEADDTALVTAGAGWGSAATLFTKVMNAKRLGAAAVLIAEHPASAEPLLAFDRSRSAQAGIPAVFLTAAAAERLVPGYAELVAAAEEPESVLLYPERTLGDVGVAADVRREKGRAQNVLGLLRGAGRERTVVVGAHFDHLGRGGEGSLAPDEQGAIHNGADDNASGTAAVLEIARLMAAGPEPAGDVLFALWSGEELGLLGSEHWAKAPTIPLERVAANLNLDMVGRAGAGKLTVLGAGTAAPIEAWLQAAAAATGLELAVNRSGQGIGGSDHQTFLRREIPSVHLFSGIHGDYHKPSDDVERFEAEGAARVAELGALLVQSLQSEPLEFVAVAAEEGEAERVRGGFEVWFGTVPDYAFEGPGLLLGGTSPGSPAEKAGFLEGDVIHSVGEVEVETIYDFMHALQIYKPGDVVLTRYERDGAPAEVRVTLATRAAR